MTATTTPFGPQSCAEVIPGYELIERIGVGGCGEVWKAQAPGGVVKAVKIIYGSVGDDRVARELKSLERLSEVHHPYLLSIDRIDVCDGRLIIVSELADTSLREEFDRHRATGLRGIPREKLLVYLGESAEALDFMYEKLSLQHLDVKPDNILLVGDHAKVADFGLVKSVCDASASLVNGLTPKYASPDVFEGRPCRYSDQYSLAVMYQEMVSGQLPFNGVTAAQLASQHLHLEPDLSSLEPRDRFAVAKALAKDPQRRFANCREFVARLNKQSSTRISFPQTAPGPATAAPAQAARSTASHAHDGATMVVAKPQVEQLPMPDVGLEKVKYRPVLFVGLGGVGGQVLRALKQLMADRLPNAAAVPSVSMLYLDTDVQAINAACDPSVHAALSNDEVLLLPLENAQAYAAGKIGQVPSLSRRWLYNVPKSLRTEGLRAVGRMALLDHTERVLERVRRMLVGITDRAALIASGEQTGLDFADYNPRVFVVASLTGGSGSGMLIDTAYAVRQILAELGLADEEVSGILTFGRMRGATTRLAVANAYACVRELNYFAASHHTYPGEALCGLAAFDEPHGPFKHTYLLDLGADLTEEQTSQAIRRQAEYLFLASLSPASAVLDACREELSPASAGVSLRTFGLARFGDDGAELSQQLVNQLCQALTCRWRGDLDGAAAGETIQLSRLDRIVDDSAQQRGHTGHFRVFTERKLRELNVNLKRLTDRCLQVATEKLESAPQDYFHAMVEHVLRKHGFAEPSQCWSKIVSVIETVTGGRVVDEPGPSAPVTSMRTVLYPVAVEDGRALGRQLAEWTLDMVDEPALRLSGARYVTAELARQLEGLRASAANEIKRCQQESEAYAAEVAALLASPKNAKQLTIEAIGQLGEQYAELQLRAVIAESVATTLANVDGQLVRAIDELREYWSNLNRIAEQFPIPNAGGAKTSSGADTMSSAFEEHKVEWVNRFDRELHACSSLSHLKLRAILSHNKEQGSDLVTNMIRVARKVLSAVQSEWSVARWHAGETGESCERIGHQLADCLEDAQPPLLRIGGANRTLVLVPATVDRDKLVAKIEAFSGHRPATLTTDGGDILLVNEGERLMVSRVLDALVRSDPQCAELGDRLHTRVDIDWRAARADC